MRLLYITSARLPTTKAHGYQIAKMSEAFQESGVKLILVAPRRHNPDKKDFSDYYKLRNKVEVIYLPCADWTFIPWHRLRFWLMILTFGLSLRFFILKNKKSQIYIREPLLALFLKGFFLEVHMLPVKMRFYHRWLFGRAKSFIVLTSFIKRELGLTYPAKKCLVSPDGVDLAEFDIFEKEKVIRQRLGLPIDKKIILYTGSFYLYGWEGVDVILETAKLFGDDVLFVLVGGNDKDLKKIKKENCLKNIQLVGFRPHSDMPYYQKAADVLLLPNKTGDRLSEECTSPLKLFEYMASGRPIVASDLPSIREVLNENNAVLVSPNLAEALKNGVKSVLINSEQANNLAIQAKKDVREHTWLNRAQKIKEFLATL